MAQIIFVRIDESDLTSTTTPDDSERGTNGFESTGAEALETLEWGGKNVSISFFPFPFPVQDFVSSRDSLLLTVLLDCSLDQILFYSTVFQISLISFNCRLI